jgi:hypothetical protein
MGGVPTQRSAPVAVDAMTVMLLLFAHATFVLQEFGGHAGHRNILTTDGTAQCSSSCDDEGGCMPLRYMWGVQKGGTTSIW